MKNKIILILLSVCIILLLIFWMYMPEYISGPRLIIAYHHDIRKVIQSGTKNYCDFQQRLLTGYWKQSDAEKILKSGLLFSANKELRGGAIYALGYIKTDSNKYIPLIIAAFSDAEIPIPESSLSIYGDRTFPYLQEALKSSNSLVRERVCNALRFVNKEKAYPLLREILLTDPEKTTRIAAAWTLCENIANPKIIKDFLTVIRNENEPRIKLSYVDKLAMMKKPEAIDAFLELIKENELPIKVEEVFGGKRIVAYIPEPRYEKELPLKTQNELKSLLKNKTFSQWAEDVLSQCGYRNLKK